MAAYTAEKKSHFLSRSWRITLVALALLVLATPLWPVVLSLPISGSPTEFTCFFGFVFVLGSWGLYEALFNRVVTSPEGIEYHFAMYRITTTWSNVKHIETNPFGIVNVVLREPALKGIPPFSWYFKLVGYDRLIQLSPYVSDWTASELVQDIRRYAPHAFETG
jgi:hypothetical protein